MKRAFKSKLILLLLPLLLLAGCNTRHDEQHEAGTRYTCPMHPQIIAEEPGNCPICKMDLVPVANASHGSVDSLAMIVKPTNELVQSEIKTVKPSVGKRFAQVSLQGVINYNTNNWNTISSRVSGRIERLYVRYNNEAVAKGQKLMDIYSPDLVNAQQELLFLKRQGQSQLLDGARRKLLLLGMSEAQIRQILNTGKVSYRVSVYSPYSGYVSELQGRSGSASNGGMKSTSASTAGSMGGMGTAEGPQPAPAAPIPVVDNAPLLIREGQYVSVGQQLFGLIDPSEVWAEFFATPAQLSEFRRGTSLSITATDVPDQKVTTTVSLIQPYYNEANRFSLVRAVIPNSDKKWRVGQLISISKESGGIAGTWLPRTAVVQLGTRAVAFMKRAGGFVPVQLNRAEQLGDWVNIGESLPVNAEVASNAWFLVDSESFIKVDTLKR